MVAVSVSDGDRCPARSAAVRGAASAPRNCREYRENACTALHASVRLFSHHYFTFSSILRSPRSRVLFADTVPSFGSVAAAPDPRPPRDLAGSPLGGPSRHRRAPGRGRPPRASVRSPRLPSAEHSLSPSPHATHRPPRPQALAAKSSVGPNGTERDRRRPVPSPAPRRKPGVSMP